MPYAPGKIRCSIGPAGRCSISNCENTTQTTKAKAMPMGMVMARLVLPKARAVKVEKEETEVTVLLQTDNKVLKTVLFQTNSVTVWGK